MAWPITFNSLTNPQPLQDFDTMFNAVAGTISIPSIASGTNAISLTPVTNSPALPAYTELCSARFRAVGNSTGPVTAQINGLGLLPVYHIDGTTQANIGDLVTGQQYIVTWSQSLNGGLGGFFLESPSVPVAVNPWYAPGGRLTLQAGVPVMFSNQASQQIIYYAPYNSPFVPIYNGSAILLTQFTSSLSDTIGLQLNMGGAANFSTAAPFDVFVYLNVGVPALCAIQWTNFTTRATNLAVFGGFLTNAGTATAQTGPNTSTTLPINRGTYLGSFITTPQGQCNWIFGAAASGGSAGNFSLANYYNTVEFVNASLDNGTSYTYTSNAVRQARASAGNGVFLIVPSSERAIKIIIATQVNFVSAINANMNTGIGINSTASLFNYMQFFNNSTNFNSVRNSISYQISITGTLNIYRLEVGDNVNANTFDATSNDFLSVSAWL